jgi:hypothetical protein
MPAVSSKFGMRIEAAVAELYSTGVIPITIRDLPHEMEKHIGGVRRAIREVKLLPINDGGNK